MQKVVLITGCSTGIGRALALEFNRKGHRVYATARRRETPAALREEAGHLDLLVNNAGLPQVGAVVDLNGEDLPRHYETNVISPVLVTVKFLPLLRAAVSAVSDDGRSSGATRSPAGARPCAGN